MIEGSDFQLRTVRESDLTELFVFFDSIRLKGDYLPSTLLSESQFRRAFLETGFWEEDRGMILLSNGKLLGAIWYERQKSFDCLELYYYIFQREDRKKGIMSEALPLFCSYLFATKKLQRLQIAVPDYSKAALRVAQKSGFQFEGIARKAFFHRGDYLDLCLYSLLRSEAKVEKIYSHD
jgi:ribosomal-protein-alanine N-acetyltransferase